MIPKFYFALCTVACALATEASVIHRVPYGLLNGVGTQIVGGRPALQGEAPYQLDIRHDGDHLCGATLVEVNGLQVGVTAAHCVKGSEDYPFTLIAGDINQTDTTGIEQTQIVSRTVVHQNFSFWTLKNDIALLFFNQSYELNDNVKVAPLPIQGQVTSQGSLKVSGWGNLEYNGNSPDELQIVEIPLVNDSYCQEAYENWFYQADDNMICTGSSTGDINPCHGDSGGPAISEAGYLAGIVSWGYECGHPDYPAVFTKVAHFMDWINAAVQDYQDSLH